MRSIELTSPAKINWFLHVGVRRPDDYHELETVFQEIDLADRIHLKEARAVSIACSDPSVPTDERNLAWKAWRALADRFDIPPVQIAIEKRIPAEGGLGGGSSNAATVLRGLVSMFDLEVPGPELARIALDLGSDVPFFLTGGTAYATGRGEKVETLAATPGWPLLLLFPESGASTAAVFAHLARMRSRDSFLPLGRDAAVDLLSAASPRNLASRTTNDLEDPSVVVAPEIGRAIHRLRAQGAPLVRVSGSGSTVFAAFDDCLERDEVEQRVRRDWRTVVASSSDGVHSL